MFSLNKFLTISKDIGLLCKRFTTFNLQNVAVNKINLNHLRNPLKITSAKYHTTAVRYDLMEFFDDKKNWNEKEVRCGRAWQPDELRIKSNSDLHKIWYILLKERNMLLTMEHEYEEKFELFPSPERLDKVELSMKNVEKVVRERNRAYYTLEIGGNGERPGSEEINAFGLKCYYKHTEHVIPKHRNKKWQETHYFNGRGRDVEHFLLHYREKMWNIKRKARNRDKIEVIAILRRYPNVNIDLLRRRYPHANIDKILREDKARGHHEPRNF